jgi:hypothetical protein
MGSSYSSTKQICDKLILKEKLDISMNFKNKPITNLFEFSIQISANLACVQWLSFVLMWFAFLKN